ncbi:hypothetical protein D3C80_1879150 [compost metagenome]
MLHQHEYLVANLRAELDQLRQLADRQEQLAAKPHLQEAAQTRMNVGYFQQCHLTERQKRLFHGGGKPVLSVKEDKHFYFGSDLRLAADKLCIMQHDILVACTQEVTVWGNLTQYFQ